LIMLSAASIFDSMSIPRAVGSTRNGRATQPLLALAVIALGTAIVAAGCSSKEEEKEPSPVVTVQAAMVGRASIRDEITTDAILYPRDQAALVPKISAPIKKFYVQRGSKVRAGELLAELENRDLLGALTENQGGYEQAEASYKNAEQSAPQDLQVAKQQLDAAQKLYDGRETLYKQGAMAAKDVEDARIALTQARNQYDLAEKAYNLKIAQGQLSAAKGRTASAQAAVDYSMITSPINGVVTDRPYNVGDTPAAGSPVLTVMNLSSVVARAHISPEEAAQLHVGDRASVALAGEPEVPGRVIVVSPALDPNSTTVQVWVEVANPHGALKPGSTVSVSIVAKTLANAIVAPADSILTAPDGTTSVMVIGKDQHAHQTAVKTGIRQEGQVQIVSGVEAGQQVVTAGAYGLPDGAKVIISKAPAPASGESE
jgi:HlyD family secretion protein